MKKNILIAMLSMMVLMPSISNAFKVETHVWVGQQVINDLEDDGQLTFKLGDKEVNILIDADVKDAILDNKSNYLMGQLGPDAAPDMVVGQTVIHPGVRDAEGNVIGWQTNDWLTYVLETGSSDPKSKAYSYGFLGHASGDVFAHTYVNQYAGDTFSIADETLVEQRHMVLEGYIAKHNPPLKNYLGQDIGNTWDQIILDDEYANFIRDNLIYNDTVNAEYDKVATATHLAGYYDFRSAIDDLANDPLWDDIDVAVAKLIAEYFGVSLSSEEAAEVVAVIDDVIKSVDAGIDEIQAANAKVNDVLSTFDDQVFSGLSSAVTDLNNLEFQLVGLHNEVLSKSLDLVGESSCATYSVSVCGLPTPLGCAWSETVTITVDPAGCLVAENINGPIRTALSELDDTIFGAKTDFVNKAEDVKIKVQTAINTGNAVINGLVDILQIPNGGSSPIKSILENWRNDVDIAMTEYVKATSQSIVNTMNPGAGSIVPITTWFTEYHLSIIGVPKTGTDTVNKVLELKGNIDAILIAIDSLANLGSSLGVPGAGDLLELKNKLIDEITDELKSSASDQLVDFLPEKIQELLSVMDQEMNATTLNAYFTKPETELPIKGIFMIPDMADRVDVEMNLTPEGYFDATKFPLVYNAIVLAKLAIINKHDFEKLAIEAGSTDYATYMPDLDNLVAQGIGDIDGNHQWMPIPPPIPNNLDAEYPEVEHGYSSEMGFVPWKGDMRDKIFRKLFIGPLSAGIDAPSAIGKSTLIQNNYPYDVCTANPYPDDINDKTCTAIMLIPILTMMLN